MLDLLVTLAAQCRVSPSGLALQLLSDDTGKPVNFKANQSIGALDGRTVVITPKDASKAAKQPKAGKQQQPFEVNEHARRGEPEWFVPVYFSVFCSSSTCLFLCLLCPVVYQIRSMNFKMWRLFTGLLNVCT